MANQKKIAVSLGFTADVSQAKSQLQQLQNSLTAITRATQDTNELGITGDLRNAAQAAAELQAHLQHATNVKTGTLDFGKLNRSIKQSGTSLQEYANTLVAMGPAGRTAFQQLATAVANSEIPLRRANVLVDELWDSLKKTAKWQLSSSAIHSLVGSFQTAYNYSKDLNKSLNDIRIVSQKSSDEMARFATQANKAAKSLSSSTLDYTEAALIYYQQGLSDEQIKQRTDTTIKMANVTGENAENVSSYMTAIWNNFAKGSEDLEYYADVITALGAATASSSEEIAGGLEKFAAIGETVGLSYEYATSALATVVAATRQSEDTVGTSFKTLFARIQGLQQGEEQEDGVTLNKYSQALANVGINVLNTNGELKKMDDILNELGNRWNTISESQQVALAQTVGGTRQYAQLISLMDNWEQFQKNLNTAYNAEGSLEKQSQIYEESWQAASKRVQTALESIYDKLINDDGFIALLNVAEDFLNVIDRIIDGVGGLGGVLSSLGAIATQVFSKQMAQGINDMAYSLKMSTEGGRRAELAERTQVQMGFNNLMAAEFEEAYGNNDPRVNTMKNMVALESQLLKTASSMSEIELRTNQALYDRYLIVAKNAEAAQLARDEADQSYKDMSIRGHQELTARFIHDYGTEEDWKDDKEGLAQYKSKAKEDHKQYNKILSDLRKTVDREQEINSTKYSTDAGKKRAITANNNKRAKLMGEAETLGVTLETSQEYVQRYKRYLALKEKATKLTAEERKEYRLLYELAEDPKQREEHQKRYNELKAKENELDSEGRAELERLKPLYEEVAIKQMSFGEAAVKAGQMFSSLSAVVHSVKGMIDVLENEDLTIGEKFLSVSSSVGMLIPQMMMLTSSFASLASETGKSTLAQGIHTVAVMLGAEAADAATLKTLTLSAAMDKLKTGFLKFLPAVLPILLKLALLAGAIFLVVKAFETFKANTPEGKLEALTKKSEEAAKAARDIVGAYQDLNSELDSLKNKQDALSELTKGTLEYRLAIAELNQQLIDFLDKYDLWDRATVEMKDGVMTITNQESLFNDILEERANAIEIANANSLAANLEKAKQATFNEGWSENKIDLSNLSAQKKTIVEGRRNSDNTDAYGTEDSTADLNSRRVSISNERISNDDTMEFYKRLLSDENGIVATENGYELNISDESIAHLVKKGYDADSLKTTLSNALSDQETLKSLYSNAIKYQSHGLTEESNFNLVGSKVAGDWAENNEYNSGALQNLLFTGIGEVISERKDELLKTITISPEMREEYLRIRGIDPDSEDAKKVTADEMKGYFAQKQAEEEMTDSRIAEYASKISINSIKAIENSEKELSLSEEQLESRREAIGFSKDELDLKKKIIKESNKYSDELEANEELLEHIAISEEEIAQSAEDIPEAWEKVAKEIENGTTSSKDFIQGLDDVKDAFSDVMDTSQWDSDFMLDHLDTIKKASEGDIKAIESLSKLSFEMATQAYLENNQLMSRFSQEIGTQYLNGYQTFVDGFTSIADSIPIGETVDAINSTWGQGLNKFLESTEMTQEQVQELFNGMGFIPDIVMKDVTQEYVDLDGTVQTKTVKVPQITNLTKAGLTSVKEGIVRGQGKSSGKDKKDKKKASDEIERYHVIKEVMEDINNELDRISKAKDRAFGGDKIALMDEEIAKTKEMIGAQEDYLKQIEAYYDKDKAAIAAYGAQFDANGVITNYDALISAQIAKFNAARTDAAEEEFEKFKKVLEQYEETSDLVAEERQELIDKENELADLLLEQLQYKIELEVEIIDDDLKYLDFLLKQVDDSAYEAADAIALLGQKTGETMRKVDTYTKGINDLFKNHGFVGDITELLTDGKTDLLELADAYSFTEEEVETLREYRDGLMESTEQLMDLRQEIRDKVIPAFEDLTAEMDNEIDKLDHLSTMLGYYKDIIDIIGKDTLGISDELMESLSVAQVDNAINKVSSSFAKLEGMRESRDELQKSLEAAQAEGNEDLVEFYEDALAEVDKQIAESAENAQATLVEALQSVTDAYDAAVQRSIERFEKAMSGTYGNLAALQDAYDKQQTVDERYIDDYEKIYELNKLNRDISNSIDNTDNIKGKQMLIDLQKEINALEESGVKLSEYDVNFLRQKYELRLAEIALEEAQNAKSQVRMTRDSEGNWSYTYTADQNNIASAQQNYEDVLYETQQLSTEYINNLQGQIIDAQVAMNTELAQLRADDEEGRQRVIEHYQGQIDYLTSQLQGALDNNKLIYNEDWTAYNEATGYKISAQEDYLINFDQTNLAIMSGYETLQEFQEGFTQATQQLYEDITLAAEDWQLKTDEAMKAAGTSIDTFAKDMDGAVNGAGGIVDQSNTAKDSVVEMGQTMATTFGNVLTAVDNFETNYGHLIDGVIADNNVLINSCNDVIKAWAQVDAAERRQSFETYNPTTGGTTDVSIDNTTGGGLDYTGGGSGKKYKVVSPSGQNLGVYDSKEEAQRAAIDWNNRIPGNIPNPSQHKVSVTELDTGGYTGAWGLSGKLAFLHEKELVLNKEDTSNILSAVKLIREISGLIDYRTALMGVSSLQNARLDYLQEGIEQNVHIEANFPNATNREEIKEAFSDLINRASQFANRKG